MRKPRTLADIKRDPRVESVHQEDDGCYQDSRGRYVLAYWVHLKPGYICDAMECGTIHEPTIKRVLEMMKEIRPTTPDDECHVEVTA